MERGKTDGTGSIKYWLVTVLRNEFLNLYRKRKREILDGGNIQPNPEESEEKTVIDGITRENVRKIRSRAKQKLIERLEGES